VDLEVYAEKTKYICMYCEQNAVQNCNITTAIKSFQNVTHLEYLWMTPVSPNCLYEGVKSRFSSENVCHNLIQNLLCSCLLSKDSIWRLNTENCNFACYLICVWNLLLKKVLGPKREAVTGDWIKLLNNLCSSPIIIHVIKSKVMWWAGNGHCFCGEGWRKETTWKT
jgi:hypothetical protein